MVRSLRGTAQSALIRHRVQRGDGSSDIGVAEKGMWKDGNCSTTLSAPSVCLLKWTMPVGVSCWGNRACRLYQVDFGSEPAGFNDTKLHPHSLTTPPPQRKKRRELNLGKDFQYLPSVSTKWSKLVAFTISHS
ncbi:hypothetical protein MHYP_G00063580 [Metynnis hypsauchen]